MARDLIDGLILLEEVFGPCTVCAEHDEIFSHPCDAPYDCYEQDDWITIKDEWGDDEKYPPQLTEEQAKKLSKLGFRWSYDADCFRMSV
jgi:hypothetical protein